jgi:hypothetical protein
MGRDQSGDLGVHSRIILKQILKIYDVKVWIGPEASSFEHDNELLRPIIGAGTVDQLTSCVNKRSVPWT